MLPSSFQTQKKAMITLPFCCNTTSVATPLWRSVKIKLTFPKVETWESSGIPKNYELDCRGQNTFLWNVLYIIRKALKCRCPKWPRMSHLDICSTSYGRKKGRESNWQFDSRSLKVGNQPELGLCRWTVIHHWKALKESYKFALDLIPIRGLIKKFWILKFPKSSNRGSFEIPPWESWEKMPFGCRCDGVMQKILYRGRWWLRLIPGRGESCESKVAHGFF